MIPRYCRPEMAAVWSDANRLKIMLEIEACACEAMALEGLIPESCAAAVRTVRPDDIDPLRIAEIERATRHETVAFLTHIAELAGPDHARFLHFGMTSSDVLDTCLSVQLRDAADLLTADLETLSLALKRRAFEHKTTICIGRSHGVHAEPTTFGLKLALAYAETRRNIERMRHARREVAVGAISGPVGTYSGIGPGIEEYVCRQLGLKPEAVSTQVIPRDRHAAYFAALGVISASIERIAIEIRSLQRTEIAEIEESFSVGQKGSSAMPHKRNPILAENVTGLARLVRSHVSAAFENVPLWHERDMSHSSVERVIAPDATLALDFALHRLAGIITGLSVHPERMARNLELTRGAHLSHRVLSALVAEGADRGHAYELAQRNTARTLTTDVSFLEALTSDAEVTQILPSGDIEQLFDNEHFTRYVDVIFERVFGHAEC